MNSGRVELPPDPDVSRQLAALERRTSRGGKGTIDHPLVPRGLVGQHSATAMAADALGKPRPDMPSAPDGVPTSMEISEVLAARQLRN